MYVRNYSDIDIPWTDVFQTSDKAEVERYCNDNRLAFEWRGDTLRTRQVNQASATHPVTGATVWFNQAHLFHVTNLEPSVRESLLDVMAEEDLPRNTYYGDGTPIGPDALAAVRDVYARNQIAFEWQRNDLLLLDNMLYSHGREAFAGNRQVLTGMARVHGTDVSAGAPQTIGM
jgi:alpha-ketoglutarate-dependent taurine dioxygenase